MIRASQSRWVIATAVMALAAGGLAFVSSPASAGGKSNKPAVVTVDAVPSGQSVTVTYTINRAHKAVASQTCTLDGNSTPCDTSPNSASGKPVKTTYSVTIGSLANGEHTFAVSFLLADGNGGSNSATFTINYTPPNQAPVANDDSAETLENTSVTFNVLTNDSDPDGDAIDVIAYIQPANGSVASTGTPGLLIYTPNTGFTGTDSFTYTIRETGGLLQDSATVTITVVADPYPAARTACEGQPPAGTFTLDDPGRLPGAMLWGCIFPAGATNDEIGQLDNRVRAACNEGGYALWPVVDDDGVLTDYCLA